MYKSIIVVLALMVSALALPASAQVESVVDLGQTLQLQPMVEDPGVPDTVRVQTKSVPIGTETFTVDVYLYNDEELAGMQIPLGWSSSDFIVDSVSFVGSRISYVGTKPVGIDTTNQRLIAGFLVIYEAFLQPGSGTVFTLYCRADPGTTDQILIIDSTFYPPAGALTLSLTNALTFTPQMVAGTVTYGNPPTNPTISLDPTSFSFDATQDGANPPSQSLTIANTGAGTLDWTASKNTTWLTLSPTSGTGDAAVTVSVDITGLTAGTYYDTITVSDPSATNDPQKAPVTLVVAEPPPTISLSPTSFSYTITQGDDLGTDHLFITNTGGGTLNWTATKNSTWLTLNPASGTGDADVSLIFSVAALTPGTYYDTITVAATGATNTPQKAPVTLVVEEPPPHIVLSPTSFSYTITEGDALGNDELSVANGGGGTLNWTASNLSAWLSIDPASGVGDDIIALTFDVTGLTAATYYDTITVADPAADNSPQKVPVTLVVEPPPPTIAVDPTSFSYAITEGDNIADAELTISNTGGSVLNWTVSNLSGWLTLNPTSGSGDDIVTLSFAVSGLTAGDYYDTITVSDPAATNNPVKVPVAVTVSAVPVPIISVSPTSFSFTAEADGADPPSQDLTITNIGEGTLEWTVTKTSGWLNLDPTSGSGDGSVTVSVDITGLSAGVYYDTIQVVDPGASNSPKAVPVMLTVTAPPHIVLAPTSFSYTITEGDALANDQLGVVNGGGGTLNWTASNLSAWLSIDPTSGVNDGVIALTFDVAGLTAGTYYDTITVADPAADNSPQKAPVTLVVEPPPPTIAVDPTSFTYAITEGDNIADAELTISNTGGSVLNWTVSNLSGWLTLNPTSGSGDDIVTLSFAVSGLTAGDYYDTITVSDPAATNNPVKVPVTVTVSSVPVPIIGVSPTSFSFTAEAGGTNPPSQDLTITNIGQGTLEWTVTKTAGWLSLDPTSGSGDGSVTVSVDITGLSAAVYYDTIQVVDPGAGNSPKAVPVMLTVTPKPMIVLDPTSIELSTPIGVNPPAQTILVLNGGGGELNWTASNTTGWLTIDPTSGGPDDTLITLNFDVTGMTEGTYYDTVMVTDPNADNSPQKTAVTLTILPAPPEISLDPTLIELTAAEGAAIPAEQITVTNTGGGTLDWTATNKTGWISLDPTSGTGDGVITLSFDITGMGPGAYIDTINVSDPAATNSPQACVVELTVTEALPDADTVYVETVDAIPGQQVMVGVNYVNFTTTYRFSLPLSFDPTDVVCDSVSFAGTRIVISDESYIAIDSVNGTILIQGLTMGGPILEAGSGLIAKMFFTVDVSAAAQFVTIDTAYIAPSGNFLFEDSSFVKKTEFFPGGIDIAAMPCFSFPTDTVTFDLNYGGIVPSISFPVTNTCGGILEWTVTVADDWAIVTPTSGVQDDQVTFTVDTAGLTPGTYVTTATFESNGTGTPYVVVIVLDLVSGPEITVTPETLDLGSICRGETASGSFDITNSGDGVLEWQADALDPVTLSVYSGTAPSIVDVEIPTDGLEFGPHTFEISVTSAEASNSPQTVYAELTVVQCGECSFDIAEVDGPQSLAVPVPVYAFGIENAAGLQFNISYDPSIVVPDSVTSAYMSDPTIGFVDNTVHYVWEDIYNPITVPNGEPIITIWFTVIGEVGEVDCFEWTGLNEVSGLDGVPFEGLTYCGGCLTVVEPYFDLYGNVTYYDLTRPVPGVAVDLTGDAAATSYTDDQGDYVITDLLSGDYLLTPSRFEDDPGVSVQDALKIRRHIAYVELFDSPFKLIAADVNLSGTVTVSDVILIRRYLAELDVLPSGNWRFVDAAFPITMENWMSAPGNIDATITNSDLTMLDFVAARMGDVDNSWNSSKAMLQANGSAIELTIPDLIATPSGDIDVPVMVNGFAGVAGVEIHITFDPSKMSVDGISSAYLTDPTVNAVGGRVHLIWDDFENPVTLQDNDSLMLIHCHIMPDAVGDIPLDFMATCELADDIAHPFSTVLNNGKLELTPTDADGTETGLPMTFGLKQNYPNPFNPSTTVSYTVDHTMSLTFEVFNVSGQLVERRDLGRKSPGVYSFVYHAGNLPSGVYTYRLTGDGVSLSKQMMLIK